MRTAVVWLGLFGGLTGGYGIFAPAVEDWQSGMRAMRTDCRVIRVIDGDTVDLDCPGRPRERARIVGYDSPELFSPSCEAERAAADRARRVLETWVRDADAVETAFVGRDRYDRALVDMRLDDVRVAVAMVEAGHGRRYLGSLRGGWC
jgi:endonuclease YncB( thermonuclease family)